MPLPLWTVTPCYPPLSPCVRPSSWDGFALPLGTGQSLVPLDWCEQFCLSHPAVPYPDPVLLLLGEGGDSSEGSIQDSTS